MSHHKNKNAQDELLRKALMALNKAKEKVNALEGKQSEAIAIVGMACRFPDGADDVATYWDLLVSGKDGVTDMSHERWTHDSNFDFFCSSAGLLSNITDFDATVFKISEEEARYMDPQQRILLETAWRAIENTGYSLIDFNKTTVGVFVGMMNHDYGSLAHEITAYTGSGTASSIASGRLSYCLNLTGPSLTIDTACSSSLLAVHYACQSLRNSECNLALAAGVNIIISPARMRVMAKANMLSNSGRCHVFAQQADGYVRAEGCGVLVLKRLSDAIKANDNIHAIIRGSAVNQDGYSQGLTAPNGPAQQIVMRKALQVAGVPPKAVSYVEAHGTGTALGDPVEAQALQEVYGVEHTAENRLKIGSVKSNIGHAESAAGMASLFKVILALQEQILPANLHFTQPNPHIPWDIYHLEIVDNNTPWPKDEAPRIAGVSSFSFSGTNSHVIIEESPSLKQKAILQIQSAKPFQHKQSYWLDVFTEGNSNLFLTGNKNTQLHWQSIPLPDDKKLFTSQLYQYKLSYLTDHQILGQTIVPATLFIEMINSVMSSIFVNTSFELNNVQLHNKLLLSDQAITVNLIVSLRSKNNYLVEIYSHQQLEHKTISLHHCSANVCPIVEKIELPISLQKLQQQCQQVVSGDKVYQLAKKASIDYGDSFKNILSIAKNNQQLIAEISTNNVNLGNTQTRIHPALVDACLQSLTIQLYTKEAEQTYNYCYLPVSIEKLHILSKPTTSEHLFIYADLVHQENEYAEADIYLFDKRGIVYCFFKQIRFYKVPHADIKKFAYSPDTNNCFYEQIWEKQFCFNGDGICSHITIDELILFLRSNEEFSDFTEANKGITNDLENISLQIIINALDTLSFNLTQGDCCNIETFFETSGIQVRYKQLFHRMLNILSRQGFLQIDGTTAYLKKLMHVSHITNLIADFKKKYPNELTELNLLVQCAAKIPEVLLGNHDALQLLLSTDNKNDAESVYQNSISMRKLNQQAAAALRKIIKTLPAYRGLRILEIGAGTGSTTMQLLPELNAAATEYTYTDISPLLLQKAEQKFARYPFIHYQVLDIEQDLQSQGLQPHHFDVIIAANVLHATKDIKKSLQHIQGLMSHRGVLFLLEMTADQAWLDLTYGLTEGWWRFKDKPLRKDHPLLSREQWLGVLKQQNYDADCIDQNESSESFFIAQNQNVILNQDVVLLLGDEGDFLNDLAKSLRKSGIQTLSARINPDELKELEQLLQQNHKDGQPVTQIISLVSLGNVDLTQLTPQTTRIDLVCAQTKKLLPLLQIILKDPTNIDLWLVTENCQAINDSHAITDIFNATIWGIAKTLSFEHSELSCHCVDIDATSVTNIKIFLSDILSKTKERYIAYRGGVRFVARLNQYTPKGLDTFQSISDQATYLVAGGHGGLGLQTVEFLFAQGARHFLIFGRNPPTADSMNCIAGLRNKGADIIVKQVNICDFQKISDLFKEIKQSMPPLRGIVDAVGVLDDGILLQQDWQRFSHVLKPKVIGTWYLHQLSKDLPLDFFVMYSSIASLIGSAGQANHAAANAFLDSFAHYRKQQGLPATTINWGVWSGIGAADKLQVGQRLAENKVGIGIITTEEGSMYFEKIWQHLPTQLGIFPMDWQAFTNAKEDTIDREFFSKVLPKTIRNTQTATKNNNLALLLKGKSMQQQRNLLLEHIHAKLAVLLRIENTNNITPHSRLFDLGLDSLMAIELRRYLSQALQRELRTTLLFDYPTTRQIVDFLLQSMPNTPQNTEMEENLGLQLNGHELCDEIASLTDEEAEKQLLKTLEMLN